MKNSPSRVMHMAHILAKQEVPFGARPRTWSENVQYAWYFEQFRAWLNNGIVTFSFWKKDGSIREAKATLNDLLIPLDKRPHMDLQHEPNYSAIAFFDLDKQDWRSFSITNFIGFVTRWEVKESGTGRGLEPSRQSLRRVPPKCKMKRRMASGIMDERRGPKRPKKDQKK